MEGAGMANPESASEHIEAPRLTVINGEGALVWNRTLAEFEVTTPITPELFSGSNLMRRLQPRSRVIRSSRYGKTTETIIERTSRSAIVGEVYRRCLPSTYAEFVLSLEQQASAEEIAYEAEGMADDPKYQAHLAAVARVHSDSLVMQGFEAFSEAALDFIGPMYEDLLRDSQRFAAYLIEISLP